MRVPSYEEAINPNFWQEGKFEAADVLIRDGITELCRLGVVHGALLYGSGSFGDTNLGSDRDMIVAYNGPVYDTELSVLERLHSLATKVHGETGVPLEVTCATLEQFQEGEHTLTDQALAWIQVQPDQHPLDVIGHDFVGGILPQRRPPTTDFTILEAWLTRTHHMLQKEYLQGHYFQPNALLGQIYGAPTVVTRRTVDALQTHGFASGVLEDLTKQGIANSLFAIYDRSQAVSCRLYDEITASARLFYEHFLPSVQGLSQEDYDRRIQAEIDVNLPKAIHLLTRMQMIHRCARAHFRLRIVPYEEQGLIILNTGDEDEFGAPFLPRYLRDYMVPCDLNGQAIGVRLRA